MQTCSFYCLNRFSYEFDSLKQKIFPERIHLVRSFQSDELLLYNFWPNNILREIKIGSLIVFSCQ